MKQPSSPKRISLLSKSALTLGCMLMASHVSSAAILLDYWDFNNVTSTFSSPNLGSFATTSGASSPAVNNGEIYNTTSKLLSSNSGTFTGGPVFSTGSLDLTGVKGTANGGNTSSLDWGVFSDSGSVAANDPATKQGSLGIFISTPVSSANNPVLVFNLSSAGYTTLTLSFDGRKAGNSSAALPVAWSYSLDGGSNYTSFTTPTLAGTAGAFASDSFSLPVALNNLSSFKLKAAFDFTANNVGTSFAIDNFQLNAAAAVPEPRTMVLFSLGGMVIFFGRRFRARQSQGDVRE